MISSRRTTRPALRIRSDSRSNSRAARCSGDPAIVTVRASRSTRRSATSSTRLVDGPTRPAQDRADPRDELPRRERLHDVVVGPELETDDAVGVRAPCRQHHDRHVRQQPAARDRGRVRRRRAASRRAPRPPVARARTSHARRRPCPRRSPRTPRARGARREARRSPVRPRRPGSSRSCQQAGTTPCEDPGADRHEMGRTFGSRSFTDPLIGGQELCPLGGLFETGDRG